MLPMTQAQMLSEHLAQLDRTPNPSILSDLPALSLPIESPPPNPTSIQSPNATQN